MLSLKESLKHYTTVQLRKALSNYNKSVKISGYSKLARSDLENLIILNASKFQHMILEKAPEEKKKVKKPMVKKEEKPVVKEEEKKEVKPMVKKEEDIDKYTIDFDKITKYGYRISELTHSNNKDFLPDDEILNTFNSFNPREKKSALSATMDYYYIVQKKFNDHYKINEKLDFSTASVKLVEDNIQKFYKIVKEKQKEEEDFNKLLKSLEEIIKQYYLISDKNKKEELKKQFNLYRDKWTDYQKKSNFYNSKTFLSMPDINKKRDIKKFFGLQF